MAPSENPSDPTRRQFLKRSGVAAVGATVLGQTIPAVHAAENNTIRLAIIGCGGRGNGAVANALNTSNQGPIELYAVAELDEAKVEGSLKPLSRKYPQGVNVAKDRIFLGFEAYKEAIDALSPGDIALCTTRAYIRPVHVEYAVKKGINVFMEKPFSPDPVGLHRMLKAGELAEKNGVKIAAGLQCRHSPARAALIDKINSGELGELSYIRANRLTGRRWMGDQREKSNQFIEQLKFGKSQLMWVGSGHMVDNLIHQIDECCWLMDDWPVSCHGMGGREVGSDDHGQNNDIYSMEYTFPNGKKAFCGFRRAQRWRLRVCHVRSLWQRNRGSFPATFTKRRSTCSRTIASRKTTLSGRPPRTLRTRGTTSGLTSSAVSATTSPTTKPSERCMPTMASLMGRAAAHLNRTVTWDEVMNSDFQFCDYLEDLTEESEPPALADADGFFPAPEAGKWVEL